MKEGPVEGYALGTPNERIQLVLRQAGTRSFQKRAGALPKETTVKLSPIKLNVNLLQAPTMRHPLFLWLKAVYNTVPGGKILEQLQQVLRWRLFAGKKHPVSELLHLGWYQMILSDMLWEKEHGKPRSSTWE